MFANNFFSIAHKLVDWITRRRSAGVLFLRGGIVLLGATLSVDFLLDIKRSAQAGPEHSWEFKFGMGDGLPLWMTYFAYGLGVALTLVGTWMLLRDDRRESAIQLRARLIVTEIRGLDIGPDTTSYDSILPEIRGSRQPVTIDFRPKAKDDLVDPKYMLGKLNGMKATINALTTNIAPQDLTIAIGGLAAVPGLFFAGTLFEDESRAVLIDWDRDLKTWTTLNGADDGDRFLPLQGHDQMGNFTEAVLAVSASYLVEPANIAKTFSASMPVVHLRMKEPRVNRFGSEAKQWDCTRAFRNAIQALADRGVRKIHLLLASPASLAIRFGMAYCGRNMPELVVYQFEKSSTPPFPWGLRIPSHGDAEAAVVSPPQMVI